MSKKQKLPTPEKNAKPYEYGRKDALFQYTLKPESYPRSVMVDFDEDFVLIRDMYAKSMLHLLLIPRSLKVARVPPYEALTPEFTNQVRAKIASLASMLGYECTRLFGTLVTGSWMDYLKVGVHALPSMNHVHVHIMTPDLCSLALKTKAHYQSFATPFFIPLSEFPKTMEQVDAVVQQEWKKKKEMTCWQCNAACTSITDMKSHLVSCWKAWLGEHVVEGLETIKSEKKHITDDDDTQAEE